LTTLQIYWKLEEITDVEMNYFKKISNKLKVEDFVVIKKTKIIGKISSVEGDAVFKVDIGKECLEMKEYELLAFAYEDHSLDHVEKAPSKANSLENFEKFLVCPITLEILENPVVASDGVTYSEESLKVLIDRGNSGVHEKKPLQKIYYPNHSINSIIKEFLNK
jgi:hypothetical protein